MDVIKCKKCKKYIQKTSFRKSHSCKNGRIRTCKFCEQLAKLNMQKPTMPKPNFLIRGKISLPYNSVAGLT